MKKIFTFFVLFKSIICFTQTKYELKGYLLDEINNPLYAKLIINNGITEQIIQTNSDGYFSLFSEEGIIEIKCLINDTPTYIQKLDLKKNELITLHVKRNKEINEVIISEEKKKKIIIQNKENIKFNINQFSELPSLTGLPDISKILQLTPGVQNSGDVNGYLYVRGGDAGQTIFRYNDVPIYGSAHLFGIFPFYNTFHIGDVIYDKTNLNSSTGNVLGASIILKPDLHKIEKETFSGNIGLLSSQFNLKFPFQKSKVSFSFRKTYIDEILKLFTIQNDVNYKFDDINLSVLHNFNSKSIFTFDWFYSKDQLKYNSDDLFANININWSNYLLNSQFNHIFSENSKYYLQFYFSGNQNRMDINQGNLKINIETGITDIGIKNTFFYNFKKIKTQTGFMFNFYKIVPYNLNLNNFGLLPNRNYPNSIVSQLSLYEDLNFNLTTDLQMKLALRFNYLIPQNEKGIFSFEPKLGFYLFGENRTNYFLTITRKSQNINLVTSSSVGIPTDFWTHVNHTIPLPISTEISLGTNIFITKKWSSTQSIFYNAMQNLTIYPFALSQFNETVSLDKDLYFGRGNSYGYEFILKKDVGKWKGWLSYTWSRSLRNFPLINNDAIFYSKYDRRHNMNMMLTFDINSKTSLGLTQIVSSGNRFTSANQIYFINNVPVKEYNEYNNAQLPTYFRTDFSINYWLSRKKTKESKLSLSIYNLFNYINPIFQYIKFNESDQEISIQKEDKVFYRMLPSVSWYYKF
ncbi:TonB-dependent receptor plug domain-containing protein [Flavobacterium oreochromis]|uniref:TonB-dependent receptor plug domain-containing protein n=1 Tax=Flavobacterium columnare TaxID=996 RepID=A0A246G8K0_9FLAO|nr:hypothetical protein [Flavobacterium oreochromis]OWP75303.1 hypothetical protein BWK62_12240 [Flavobacterium oreochromis]